MGHSVTASLQNLLNISKNADNRVQCNSFFLKKRYNVQKLCIITGPPLLGLKAFAVLL